MYITKVEAQQWGAAQSFQYTPPTQQTPTPANTQFGQMNKFFQRPIQTPSWGASPNPTPQNAWNFRQPVPNNMAPNVPVNVPGAMPNMPGNMPNSMMNSMRNLMGNMRPGVTPNIPGSRGFGSGYPNNMCYAPPNLPYLCTEKGENQHKFTLKEVMRMLGDKNIEKIPYCVPGIQRVNCANYDLAQYIWQRGYCYCKRYHSNMNAFKKYEPLRCVLNNCGACSQEFFIGKSRIVDCD